MDKCKNHIAVPKEEAVAALLANTEFSPKAETVPIREAAGRVSAGEYRSKQTLPSIKSAAKDGIAVRAADFADGMPDTSGWKEGRDYVHCFTGVGIHGDFDAMIMIEQVLIDENGRVTLLSDKLDPELVAPPGRVIREGELILSEKERITPYLVTRLAAGGWTEVEVLKKPVVAFIPTGSELVRCGEAVPAGMNVDTNSLMFEAKMRYFGAIPMMYDIVADDPALISEALADALEKADIVALNGGSSKGLRDYTVEVIEKQAKILSHMIKSGPGAHTSCSIAHNGKPVVGIAGPAIGAEALTDWFIKPLIDKYLGQPDTPLYLKARYRGAELSYTQHPGEGWCRRLRGHIFMEEDGSMAVELAPFGDSRAVDHANCFIAVTNDGIREGDLIRVELRWPFSLEDFLR